MIVRSFLSIFPSVVLFLALAACGGGGAESTATTPAPAPSPQLTWDQGNWNDKNWQ